MPARRITTVTVPVDPRSAVALESYPARTPLLSIRPLARGWWSVKSRGVVFRG
jgi:hypothetical protein